MKVSSRGIEKSQAVLEVEVEQERVDRALDAAYRRVASRVNVPGFRPGRAPRSLVERLVGREALLEDAIEHLLPSVYQEVIREQQLEPIASPKLELVSVQPFQFRATVPLKPQVQLGDYRSVRIEPEPTEPTPEEIEAALDELRQRYAAWVPVERPVQLGDRVSIDLRAVHGERVVLDSKDAEYVLDPEGREPAPGFNDRILGMAAGETRSFVLDWPSDARDQTLAGQPVEFTVAVNWVKEKQLPPADDEFAVQLGEFETIAQVRAELADQIRRQKSAAARQRLEDQAVQEVLARSTFDVPPRLVEEEAEERFARLAQSLDRQGISVEQFSRFRGQSADELRQELRASAEADLRRSFVLEAIAEAEGIVVAAEEIDQEIERAVADLPREDPRRKAAFTRPETRRRAEALVRERKALARLLELAAPAQPAEGAVQA